MCQDRFITYLITTILTILSAIPVWSNLQIIRGPSSFLHALIVLHSYHICLFNYLNIKLLHVGTIVFTFQGDMRVFLSFSDKKKNYKKTEKTNTIMNHSVNASSSLNGSSMRVPVSDPFDDAFFDMDDILASQERLACVVETPLRGLGFLDASHDTPDLSPGMKLELPFWLVKDLAGRRRVVTPELPKPYREGKISYRWG